MNRPINFEFREARRSQYQRGPLNRTNFELIRARSRLSPDKASFPEHQVFETSKKGRLLQSARQFWQLTKHSPGIVKKLIVSHRALSAGLALLVIISVAMPVVRAGYEDRTYRLSDQTKQLLGEAPSLKDKLTFNPEHQQYEYNPESKAKTVPDGGPSMALGAGGGEGSQEHSPYSVDLAEDAEKGITMYENATGLSFKLKPKFKAGNGKLEGDRVVYPLSGGIQAVYTVKGNGLKEDIVVPKAIADQLSFKYQLELPDTLEARLDEEGNLGIYSADPLLFGNITTGSEQDQAKVDQARKNGQKNNLVFMLPAPIIQQFNGAEGGRSVFKLSGSELTVEAEGLKDLSYPLSIDPSVVVSTTAGFADGNNEGNVDFSGSNQITRAGHTGGRVGSWSSATDMTTGTLFPAAVWLNDYLYIVGTSAQGAHVQYAKLGSSGNFASDAGCGTTWCQSTTTSNGDLPSGTSLNAVVAYNGYIYSMGGTHNGSTPTTDIYYIKPASDGSLGSWTTSGVSLPTTCNGVASACDWRFHIAAAYNGNLYVFTGNNDNTNKETYHVPVKADGSLGTFVDDANMNNNHQRGAGGQYNGYLYASAGGNNAGTNNITVEFAKINSDGTVSSWVNTTSLTTEISETGRYEHIFAVYNGYAYVMGGGIRYGGCCDTVSASVMYAPILANGSVGTWRFSTSLTFAENEGGGVAYKGYLYKMDGNNCSTSCNKKVIYSAIGSAGVVGTTSYSTSTTFTTARHSPGVAVHNGFMYVAGGYDGSNNLNSVYYAAINNDGSLGSWSSGGTFTTARRSHFSVAVNGYLYVVAGYDGSNALSNVQYAAVNTNGSLGSWGSTTSAIPAARANVRGATWNGYIYVTGGNSGSNGEVTTYYAKPGSTGDITSWSTAGNNFSTGRLSHGSIAYNGYLYVLGGVTTTTDTAWQSDVQYAALSTSDGSVGTWASTTSFTTARKWMGVAVHNGYMYITGGRDNATNNLTDVQLSLINSDGTVNSWSTTTAMSTGRVLHVSVVYNGFLYNVAGDAGGVQNSAIYAPLSNGGPGAVGAWSTGNSFTTARDQTASVAYNGYLYVVAGHLSAAGTSCKSSGSTAFCTDVQYATINTDGSVGTWTLDSDSYLGTQRGTHALVAYNGYMYAIGGANAGGNIDVVEYAQINSNGTLGSWNTTATLPAVRGGSGAAAANGYMYVLGGENAAGTAQTSVYYTTINNDGTLASWTTSGNSLGTARDNLATVAYNGYIYAIAGRSGGTRNNTVEFASISGGANGAFTATMPVYGIRSSLAAGVYNGYIYITGGGTAAADNNDVQYAPILSNGRLETWSTTSAFTNARNGHGTAISDGKIYITGGNATGTHKNDTQYATLQSIPRQSHYSKVFNLERDVTPTKHYVLGGSNSTRSTVYKLAPSSTAAFGSLVSGGTITETPSSVDASSTTGQARYYWVKLILDDSETPVFPVTQSTVSEYRMYYRANSGFRLRGGKTFTNQIQQSLDASP